MHIRRSASHIVGYGYDADINTFGTQTFGGNTEIKNVSGVIAKSQQNTAALVRLSANARHCRSGRRSKYVTSNCCIREARPDVTSKCRVMTRATSDNHSNFALRHLCGTNNAATHVANIAVIDIGKPGKSGRGKLLRRVENRRH